MPPEARLWEVPTRCWARDVRWSEWSRAGEPPRAAEGRLTATSTRRRHPLPTTPAGRRAPPTGIADRRERWDRPAPGPSPAAQADRSVVCRSRGTSRADVHAIPTERFRLSDCQPERQKDLTVGRSCLRSGELVPGRRGRAVHGVPLLDAKPPTAIPPSWILPSFGSFAEGRAAHFEGAGSRAWRTLATIGSVRTARCGRGTDLVPPHRRRADR